MKALSEHMECRARFLRTVVADQMGHTINEDAPSADAGGFFEEHAISLLQLLPQYLARGKHDFQPALPFQLLEIPPEQQRVPLDLVRRRFEEDKNAGLVELARTSVHEL